jgi:shikimate kinase
MSHGAITVINAIPCGIGAAVGIDLRTHARFVPGGRERSVSIANDPNEDTKMARICVMNTFKHFRAAEPEGWSLAVDSEIPISRGLKSSSSACNAIVSAVAGRIAEDRGTAGFGTGKDAQLDMIKLGVKCAIEANVTVTGAFDDACACHLGGFVITDNEKMSLIRHTAAEKNDVILLVPEKKIRKPGLDRERFYALSGKMEKVVKTAERDWHAALTLNGELIAAAVGIDDSIAKEAMRMGALAAGVSGTGPAIAAVVGRGDGASFLKDLDISGYEAIIAGTR